MFEVTMTTTTKIEDQRIEDLLVGAFEGGSNYWAIIKEHINPNNVKVECAHRFLPLIEGCGLVIADVEDEDSKGDILNRKSIAKGLQAMGEKYDWHLKAFLKEEDDAETADVFLQCCLFGKIVFG